MTSSSPDEAIHFRGKTLTPESPRPLHIPEPSNIPVLLNQMDPIFNDTATYDKPNSSHERSLERASLLELVNTSAVKVNGGGEGQDPGSFHAGSQQANGERDKRIDVTLSATTNTFPSNHSSPSPSTLLSASTSPTVTESSIVPGEANPNWSTRSSDAALLDPPISRIPSQAALPLPSPLPQAPPAPQAPSSAAAPAPAPVPFPALPVALGSLPPPPPAPFPTAPFANNEVDVPDPRSNLSSVSQDGSFWAQSTERTRRVEDGVDFENLLDNLSSSTSTAQFGPAIAATVSSPANDAVTPQPMSERALPPPMGLPPRPPPQEKPSVHPNYAPSDDIRSYHQFPSQNPSTSVYANATPQSNYHPNPALPPLVAAPGAAPGMSPGANGLPPPPVATFQQQPPPQPTSMKSQESNPQSHKNNRLDRHAARQSQTGDDDAPWGPDVQKKYDEFLHDERVYVTEGLWDRFPQGSRLFVGNLPTERVTKRDLFHVFHKYGKLAQISIKQAYGFVQFLDATACYQALQAEQGGVVRGRKIHLEISKPQRNSRQAPPPTEPARSTTSRRSRSPDYGRNSGGGGGGSGRSLRSQTDRYERSYEPGRPPFSDFRDEPASRRRDDYRPPRSPSPRAFRARDEYRSRDRTPERYDRRERRRSRSPYSRDRRYRSLSPRARGGGESDSDLPRRALRDVPDVQIIVLEDVDGNFIYHVESSFKSRGLKVDVLILNPRVSISAVIRRQIVEGVIGVVKVARSHQFSGKIPLQIFFDRSSGVDNVRSQDYAELDLNVAAELVIHAQSTQRTSISNPYPPNPGFSAPQFPPAPPQPPIPSLSNPSQIASLISTLDAPSLQSLLGALQQAQPPAQSAQPQFAATNASNPVDLASLLSNATRHQNPQQAFTGAPGQPPQPLPAPPFGLQASKPPIVPDPNNLMSLLAKGLGGHPPPNQTTVGPQVQNIVNQFAKWKH